MTELHHVFSQYIQEIIYVVKLDGDPMRGRIEFINNAVIDALGYEPQAFMKDPDLWLSLIHPDDLLDFRRSTIAMCETKKSVTRTYRLRHGATGEYIRLEDKPSPIADAQGNIGWYVGIATDVTRKTKTEDGSGRLEERFRGWSELSLDGMAIHDHGKLVTVNDAFVKMFGYNHQELIGMSVLDLAAHGSRALLQKNILAARHEPFEAVGLKKDGATFNAEIHGDAIFYNELPMRLAIIRDITGRKHAEEFQSVLYRIAQTASTAQTLNDLFRSVHETIQSIMPAKNFYIALYDERNKTLSFPYFVDEVDEPPTLDTPVGKGLTAYVLRTGKSLLCDDKYSAELDKQGEAELVGAPSAIWLGVPLIVEQRIIGVMVVQHYSDPGAYTERDQRILEFVSSEVARVIDRKQAYENIERSLLLQSALYRIAEKSHSAANLNELYAAIHGILNQLMYARNCYIALYDAASGIISFPYSVDEKDVVRPPRESKRGLTEYILRTGESLLATPKLIEDLVRREEVVRHGAPSHDWMGVPLKTGTVTFGALVLQSYEPRIKYGEKEIDILTFVSGQIAAAIEAKRNQDALTQSESKYRSLFEQSQMAVFLSTVEGTILDINLAGVELFGYSSKEELTGADMFEALFDNPNDGTILKQALRMGSIVKNHELIIRRKNGERRTALITVDLVREKDSNTTMCQGFLRDITENKLLEEQIRQMQKLESIGTLAGGIAHDFNNILGIIMGHASLMKSVQSNPEKLSQSIETIASASRRGASLVKQLLTFAHKGETLTEAVQLNNIIVDIKSLITETFPKTIVLSTSLARDLPPIMADSTQLHQVFLNICVNARDAMPKGGTLSISTNTLEGAAVRSAVWIDTKTIAHRYVHVEVADSGVGMDEVTRQRIFEPFFTTKGVGKGTGLGLALVFGIVKNHDGFITVQSKPGKGTAFHVYFPVRELTAEQLQPSAKAPEEIQGGTETILLIEDEEMLRELLEGILISKGYTVLMARDGEEGVNVFSSHRDEISLVITDLGLPKASGEEVCMNILAVQSRAKIIVASGYFSPELKSELSKLGVRCFIQKPYLGEQVLASIRSVIDQDD